MSQLRRLLQPGSGSEWYALMSEVYRFRLAKQGLARFLSHLDLMRTLTRAFRRAGLELSRSAGFHPHPLLSFGPALPVGWESCAEYCDAEFSVEPERDPAEALNLFLPSGLTVLAADRPAMIGRSLAAMIDRASYHLDLQGDSEAAALLLTGLERESIPWTRRTAGGEERHYDIRSFLLDLASAGPDRVLLLGVTGSAGNLRPDELLLALSGRKPGGILRTGMYIDSQKGLLDPLTGDAVSWQIRPGTTE